MESWFWVLSEDHYFITVNRRFRRWDCYETAVFFIFSEFFWRIRSRFSKIHIFHEFRARKILKAVLESWFWVLSGDHYFITVNCRFRRWDCYETAVFFIFSQFFCRIRSRFLKIHISHGLRARKILKAVLESLFWVLSDG